MTVWEWLIVLYVAYGLWKGYRVGLLSLALSLAGYIAAFLVARAYYGTLARLLDRKLGLAHLVASAVHATGLAGSVLAPYTRGLTRDVAFLLLLVVVELAAQALAQQMSARRLRLPLVGGMNRLAGAVLGGVEHLLIVALVLIVVLPVVHPGRATLFGQLERGRGVYGRIFRDLTPSFVRTL